MRTVKHVFTSIMFFITLLPVSASMFTVSVVETGIEAEAPSMEASIAWESGLIDALFESGHIVSNFPLLRGELPYEIDTSLFTSARDGGSQYLCLAVLEYDTVVLVNDKKLVPRKSLIQIFSLESSEPLVQHITVISDTNTGTKELEARARESIRALLAKMEG